MVQHLQRTYHVASNGVRFAQTHTSCHKVYSVTLVKMAVVSLQGTSETVMAVHVSKLLCCIVA